MRKFFNITTPYKFEWGDLSCLSTMINVALVIVFGLIASWVGLAINLMEIVRDLTTNRRINLLIIHLSLVVLNTYFLLIFYGIVR